MTPHQRFLTAMLNGRPDRVPVAPDISNYIPVKRTGLPFWDVYFFHKVPLWRAYLDAMDHYGGEAWMASCTGLPWISQNPNVEWKTKFIRLDDGSAVVRQAQVRTPDGNLDEEEICFVADPPTPGANSSRTSSATGKSTSGSG